LQPETTWHIRTPDKDKIDQLIKELGCSEVLARILVNRDIKTSKKARQFLSPSRSIFHAPSLLPDIQGGVKRIKNALERNESLLIYADRDIDGVSGCAILKLAFELLGSDVVHYIPKKWDGYGLNEDAVHEIAEKNIDLVITVDCGATAVEEIQIANDLGLDVIVTDHHDQSSDHPPVEALINPKRHGSDYPNRKLSGGTVAFKFARKLVEELDPKCQEDFLDEALPLATLSTLGDYMELTIENRAIAHEGFDRLNDTSLPGLEKLVRHCDVESLSDLSWSLIPSLNAAQEDESGDLMLELIMAEDEERISEIIAKLENYRENKKEQRRQRKEHLQECFEDQIAPEESKLYFVETDQYVGGMAMHQLSEDWGRPVIAYRENNGYYQGGGRAEADIDFIELFEEHEHLLEDYWGHSGAAGFKIEGENLRTFKESASEYISTNYSKDDLRPKIEIDAELSLDQITPELVEEINHLEPYGNGNFEPQFLLKNIQLSDKKFFGENQEHLKIYSSKKTIELIWWNYENRQALESDENYDLVGKISWNDYKQKPMFKILDLRTC